MVLIAVVAFVWRVIDTIPQEPSLVYWLLAKIDPSRLDTFNPFDNDPLASLAVLFSVCVLAWEGWLTVRTLLLSANTIVHERNEQTWELLLLTNVTTWQIVRAKWQAVVATQWRSYLLLAILRIGAISLLSMRFDVNFWFGIFPSFGYGSPGPETDPQRLLVYLIAIAAVVLGAIMTTRLTMMNLLLTAACGMIGGCVAKHLPVAFISGVGTRLTLILLIAAIAGVPGYLGLRPDLENSTYFPDPVVSTTSLILALTGMTAIDNGAVAAGLLMRFGYNYRWSMSAYAYPFFWDTLRGHGPAFFTALLLSAVIYMTMTHMLLKRAEKSVA